MNVIYIICTNVGRAILKAHLKYHPKIKISCIYTLSPIKAISKSNYDNCLDLALENNINHRFVDKINDPLILKEIKKQNPNIIIQSGWSQKFSDKLLSIPIHGCIGEHPSPIPRGRGAASVNWAIINGEKNWGDSFFIMNSEYDAGPVISQKKFNINDLDDVKLVYDKVALNSFMVIKENLSDWCKGKFNYPDLSKNVPCYFKRRYPEDGLIKESMSVSQQLKFVRALTHPYPGAFFRFKNEKILVWKAKKIISKEVKNNLKKLEGNIFLSNKNFILLKAKCGDFLKPIIIESSYIPKVENKTFVKEFIKT